MDCPGGPHGVDFQAMAQRALKKIRRRIGARLAAALAMLLALGSLAVAPAMAQEPGRRLAVVLGVSRFADWSIPNLAAARGDALAVAAWLTDPAGGGFDPAGVHLLLDSQATRQNILAAMDKLVAEARPQDLVFIYLSTHGFFTADQVLGIVCHDSQATGEITEQGPVVKADTVLTRVQLHRFLGRLRARRRAVVVDICYGQAAVRGLARLTTKPRFAPGTTTLILVSSTQGQRSWESAELGASVFTHYLLQGLRRLGGDLRRAFAYARQRTTARVRREKGYQQTPYLVAVPQRADLVLGRGGPGRKQP